MDDLFHKILAHLYSINALHQETDITHFLKHTLGQDYNNPSLLQNVRTTLGQLGVSGYIARDHQPILGRPGNGSETNNLDEHRIRVKLELLGHNYIADKISKANQDALLLKQTSVAEKTGESVVSTNDFTITNAKKNNSLFWLTFAVAVISAFGTVGGCLISYRQQTQQQKQASQDTLLLQIQNRQSQSDSVLSAQQNQIDSLKRTLNETKLKTP